MYTYNLDTTEEHRQKGHQPRRRRQPAEPVRALIKYTRQIITIQVIIIQHSNNSNTTNDI